ncbi:hypothetical protein Fcan01_28435 [Folsomia candida]|uniref:Uncharacterized protein n=1 Tax=Folsomia candida TaxID=158441 RepID=A0A226CWB3_FOLCA|nr:hypothetical protein Fcan01_28435 [Folsomia candida]
MANTKAVVIHQFRQIFRYTFYFCLCQAGIFYHNLKAHWTAIIFCILLGYSFYEDTQYFDQDSMPESILVLRIWANNFPLIVSNMLMYVLERGYFISVYQEDNLTKKVVGQPEQMVVHVAQTGIDYQINNYEKNVLRVVTCYELNVCYELYLLRISCYEPSGTLFRSLIAQFRYVKRLVNENLNWTSDPNSVAAAREQARPDGDGDPPAPAQDQEFGRLEVP